MAENLIRTAYVGSGPVYIGKYDPELGVPENGFLTGLRLVGCGNKKLTTAVKVDTDKIQESCSGEWNTLYEYTKSKSCEVTLEAEEFDILTFAAAMGGNVGQNAAGSFSNQPLGTFTAGDVVFLNRPRLILDPTAAPPKTLIIKDSTGASLVEGLHYKIINAKASSVKILELTGFTGPFTATYEHEAFVDMAALVNTKQEFGLIFAGTNTINNRDGRLVIPRIKFSSDGFDWISQSNSGVTLKGSALYVGELVSVRGGPFMRVEGFFD